MEDLLALIVTLLVPSSMLSVSSSTDVKGFLRFGMVIFGVVVVVVILLLAVVLVAVVVVLKVVVNLLGLSVTFTGVSDLFSGLGLAKKSLRVPKASSTFSGNSSGT